MQSDTVIGIVGAVVLVAVMIGVFAYEYNNAPEDVGNTPDPTTPAGQMALFAAAYPELNATDDIDLDGTPNYMDDDIDGDGMNNTADDDGVVVVFNLGHNAPAHTNAAGSGPYSAGQPFALGVGYAGVSVEVNHGGGNPGNTARVQADAGDVGTCTTTQTLDCAFTNTGDAATGEYNLRLRQAQLNPNALPVTVTVTVTYTA